MSRTLDIGNPQVHTLDAAAPDFDQEFRQVEEEFLGVLSHSYQDYFGHEYHLERIAQTQAVLYFIRIRGRLVAAAYVKRNCRRGGTAVYPPEYRQMGLGRRIVEASFTIFPSQYSIVAASNEPMIKLLVRCGFQRVQEPDVVLRIVGDDAARISDIAVTPDGVEFQRTSDRRLARRSALALLVREGSHA